MSATEIATACSVSRQTVVNRLKEYGIFLRSQSVKERFHPTKIQLKKMYKGKSATEIAEIHNVSLPTVLSLMDKFQIPRKKRSRNPRSGSL